MTRVVILILVLVRTVVSVPAIADELRPGYLDLRETGANEFSFLWKVPVIGDSPLGLYVRLPVLCKARVEPIRGFEGGAFFERSIIVCPGGLKGQKIVIDGLRSTVTDAFARVQYRDGSTQIARLTPDSPILLISGSQTGLEVAKTYFLLGGNHILTSLDHLLFVLALILLISNRWKLVKTITAFTVAHSITLAGAALGYLTLPPRPVEATIALSIAFLSSELVKMKSGERRLSEEYPWVAAFTFGLLHGLGFAGALNEIGLPHMDVPLALLTFNLGVEGGQILFVVAIVSGLKAFNVLFTVRNATARSIAAYIIGTASMVWFIARSAGVFT